MNQWLYQIISSHSITASKMHLPFLNLLKNNVSKGHFNEIENNKKFVYNDGTPLP